MSASDQTDNTSAQTKLSAETAAEMLQQSKAQIQSGDFSAAQKLMTQLLADYPNHAEALYLTAVSQRLSQDYQSALLSLDRLASVEPSYGRAWQERGHVHMACNNSREARAAFQQAVTLNSLVNC